MKCPLCNTEMRIVRTNFVQNEGKLFRKQVLTCRNKKCANYQKDVKTVYTPLGNIAEDSNAEVEEA